MSGPWEKYGSTEVVSEGGPWSKYGQGGPSYGIFSPDRWRRLQALTESLDAAGHNPRITDENRDRPIGTTAAPPRELTAEDWAVINGTTGPEGLPTDPNVRTLIDTQRPELAETWANREAERGGRGKAYLDAAADSVLLGQGDKIEGLSAHLRGHGYDAGVETHRTGERAQRELHPMSSMSGDITGYLAPGIGAYKAGSGVVRGAGAHMVSPGTRAVINSTRAGRYAPVVIGGAAAGAADYGLYRGTVEGSAREAMEGRDLSLAERAEMAREGATDPLAWGLGAAASPAYRLLRGAATTVGNTVQASKQAGKFTPKAGSFTPTPRKQWAAGWQAQNDPRAKAYRMVAKRLEKDGITTEQLHRAIDNYYYAGYSSVDEMLFELAEAATKDKGGGQLKQLAVALGSVGGDAQQTARASFDARKAQMPTVFREELRKAAGLEGSDFYQYADEIAQQRATQPGPLYDEAYGKAISDDEWVSTVWPLFESSPSAHQAIDDAYQYARDIGKLEVASEIAAIRAGLPRQGVPAGVGGAGGGARAGAGANLPQKPSTEALDYIDRMLGDRAQALRASTTKRTELAKGPSEAQARLRSVLDPATGLNKGRDLSAELMAAEDALDFGRKGFAQGMDLETLQREFAKQSGRYGDEYIDPALLMGWMRGAEDAIEKATNPGVVIRQIYGSERQRNKLLAMLPDGANLGSGGKADVTKRRNVLTGRTTSEGEEVAGRFDRARRHLASENEIVGNSQTGQRNEAVAAQGGMQRMANVVADTIMNPRETLNKAIKAGVNRATQPGIFNPKVNRELGDIMFTGGRDDLKRIVGELEAIKAPPGAPVAPAAPGAPPPVAAAHARPVQNGIPRLDRTDMAAGSVGGAAGGYLGADDYNDDGVVDYRDVFFTPEGRGGILSGVAAGVLGSKGAKAFGGPMRSSATRSADDAPMPTADDLAAAEAEVIRTSEALEPLQRAWNGPGISNADDRRILDAATAKHQQALARYYNMRDALESASRQAGDPPASNGIPVPTGVAADMAGGAVGGSVAGGAAVEDLNGDGRITPDEMFTPDTAGAALMGFLGGYGGTHVGRNVLPRSGGIPPDVKTNGIGGVRRRDVMKNVAGGQFPVAHRTPSTPPTPPGGPTPPARVPVMDRLRNSLPDIEPGDVRVGAMQGLTAATFGGIPAAILYNQWQDQQEANQEFRARQRAAPYVSMVTDPQKFLSDMQTHGVPQPVPRPPRQAQPELPKETAEGAPLMYDKGVAYVWQGNGWTRAPDEYQPN